MKELILNGRQNFMGKEIPVVYGGFGEGKKCISDKTIAEIHEMREPDVRRRITDNIKRFKENVDFIDLKKGVYETHTLDILIDMGYTKSAITQAEHIYILSERGYAKLIKIMDTDLAWEIHDKLIDEYFQMREEKKRKPLSVTELIELELRAIKEVDSKAEAINEDLQTFKEELPLFNIDCEEIQNAKNRVVVPLLGGKDSAAYKDKSLRSKVYSDINRQITREFNVKSYKAIKRNQYEKIFEIIKNYKLPLFLKEEIEKIKGEKNG